MVPIVIAYYYTTHICMGGFINIFSQNTVLKLKLKSRPGALFYVH